MTARPLRVLLQTTIPETKDDWSIARFSQLEELLTRLPAGEAREGRLCEVVARDRGTPQRTDDPLLSQLDRSDFDELWLFAVDTGDGLTPNECAAIGRFRARGGGILVTRDHMDLGSSLCTLGGVGNAHYFHTRNPDPDDSRRTRDDPFTKQIQWPNWHSGANGDFQVISALAPQHPLLRNAGEPGGVVRYLPSHPHEGGVGAPADDPSARVVAIGRSKITGRPFNLIVAFEPGPGGRPGAGVAESSFHHFCDYNWDPDLGCPSFVGEPPGDGMKRTPEARRDTESYVRNLALWLAGRAV